MELAAGPGDCLLPVRMREHISCCPSGLPLLGVMPLPVSLQGLSSLLPSYPARSGNASGTAASTMVSSVLGSLVKVTASNSTLSASLAQGNASLLCNLAWVNQERQRGDLSGRGSLFSSGKAGGEDNSLRVH